MAAGYLFLSWGGVTWLTVSVWGLALGISYDLVPRHFLVVVFLMSAPLITVALGCRSGAVWAIKLFRVLVVGGLVMVAVDIAAGLLVVAGLGGFGVDGRTGGEYDLIVSVIVLTLGVVLFRKMRRVRWLDPYSTPEEWETTVNRAARRPI